MNRMQLSGVVTGENIFNGELPKFNNIIGDEDSRLYDEADLISNTVNDNEAHMYQDVTPRNGNIEHEPSIFDKPFVQNNDTIGENIFK